MTTEHRPRYHQNAELKKLSEAELFEMLFHGSADADIKQRQAAYELNRRHQASTQRMQVLFAALSVLAALASAAAALAALYR